MERKKPLNKKNLSRSSSSSPSRRLIRRIGPRLHEPATDFISHHADRVFKAHCIHHGQITVVCSGHVRGENSKISNLLTGRPNLTLNEGFWRPAVDRETRSLQYPCPHGKFITILMQSCFLTSSQILGIIIHNWFRTPVLASNILCLWCNNYSSSFGEWLDLASLF